MLFHVTYRLYTDGWTRDSFSTMELRNVLFAVSCFVFERNGVDLVYRTVDPDYDLSEGDFLGNDKFSPLRLVRVYASPEPRKVFRECLFGGLVLVTVFYSLKSMNMLPLNGKSPVM